jgi:HEAT repeat protein
MGKRVYIALALFTVALVGVIVWQAGQQREPVYQGKPLSEWLKTYAKLRHGGDHPPALMKLEWKADEAVRQIGSNAIPTLLRLLKAKDSPLKLMLVGLAKRQHIIKIEFLPADRWNQAGFGGFEVLETNAQSAVPALIGIVNQNISHDSQSYTIETLGLLGPAAKAAVPTLLQCATNADRNIRFQAILALGKIHAEPERFVPALTTALHDTDSNVRSLALGLLGRFGLDAKPAVPALIESLNDRDTVIRRYATNALKAIDPEAAAKAGIK